jgi:hypothetical protein
MYIMIKLEKTNQRECSTRDISNAARVKKKALSITTATLTTAKRYNDLVGKNKHCLRRYRDSIVYCCVHELVLRGRNESCQSLNPGIFLYFSFSYR